LVSTSEEEPHRRPRRKERRPLPNFGDFKVNIPEFEGKPDPNEVLRWMQTVERVFDFKDILEERKVKLVALKLIKYSSLWWSNLCAKRAKLRKDKIRTWDKMKAKLRS